MLAPGLAKKVSIYINEDTSSRHNYLYNEIFSFLLARGIEGATLFRPQAGFGPHHRMHTAQGSGVDGQHLPVRIEFIENAAIVERLLPELCALVADGLIEAHDTTVIKAAIQRAES